MEGEGRYGRDGEDSDHEKVDVSSGGLKGGEEEGSGSGEGKVRHSTAHLNTGFSPSRNLRNRH